MTVDENLKNLEPPDWIEQMFAELSTPEAKLKLEKEQRYLREIIYAALSDLNNGFDSLLIGHFSPKDFLIAIDRCQTLGVGIIGVEVFTTDVEAPSKLQMLDIKISPVPGYDWARRLVLDYIGESDITVCASFDVPDALLKSNLMQEGEPNQ